VPTADWALRLRWTHQHRHRWPDHPADARRRRATRFDIATCGLSTRQTAACARSVGARETESAASLDCPPDGVVDWDAVDHLRRDQRRPATDTVACGYGDSSVSRLTGATGLAFVTQLSVIRVRVPVGSFACTRVGNPADRSTGTGTTILPAIARSWIRCWRHSQLLYRQVGPDLPGLCVFEP
jgi:hypothetical protein